MTKAKRQWTAREFIKVLKDNGFTYNRAKGDHYTYKDVKGRTVTFNFRGLNCMVALRLIKENGLEVR